jgi:hypothetical protein
MSDATAAEGTPEAGAPEAQSPDLSPVFDRVDQLAGELGTLREDILGRLPEPAAPEQPADPWSQWLDEPEAAEEPEQPQLDMAALREAIRADVRAEMEQTYGPLAETVDDLRANHDLSRLYEQHPDLKDPEVKKRTGEAVGQIADRYAQRYGPEFAAVLRNDPEFIATVHQSLAGQASAAAEVAASGDPTQLEGGGGAAPGGVEQPNIVQQVMQARRGLPKGFR